MAESSIKVYDIIFAGGGATACITAGRLAAANPSLKILILEDGPETRDKPEHLQPARCFENLRNPKSESISLQVARPSQALGGRALMVPTGRCFGGGSCINFMMYTRAAASDYDDWEKKYNNPGWGFKDLLPLLQKAETYDRSAPYHGFNGPLKISYRESGVNVADDFLAAASKYDKERTTTDDVNDFSTCNAYGVREIHFPLFNRYSDPATGKRSDTAHHYVYNQIDHNKNLVVMCGRRVVGVLFEGIRAVGVEYMEGQGGQKYIAKASLLVVISAGAFGSPAILQRSGIGDAELLNKHGIKQIVDLPGVGERYMDHNAAIVPYALSEEAETLDSLFRGDQEALLPIVQEWQETGKGLLAHNGISAGIKMRPHRSELPELGEEFQTLWQEHFESAPDKPVLVACLFMAYGGSETIAASKKFVMAIYYTCYPTSSGLVHTGSSTDPYLPIDFHSGFFDKTVDIGVMRWAYKRTRELLRRMRMSRGEHASGHPKFSQGSAAECKATEGPVDIDAPDIAYSKEDDEAIDQYHRETVGSGYHSMGTCGMKPREDKGVVDPRLNVYGTHGLKVADLSICPANVGANTYNTAIAIGEKAAMLIAEDLGIKGV
ncbi:GMC oxidoreductase [Amanita muscaria Koide BX008]|uniref:GMC oxidoreductase n=1 Tax=Amanita muscaria (strain Koide BX008) TaxID=946122 RepID=A0A0C2SUL7_AMAMK|nr:GMC oxidoreductase [Amanita muscaria Koide BX008]